MDPKNTWQTKRERQGRGRGVRVPKGIGHGRGCGTRMPKKDNKFGGNNLTHNEMGNENELGIISIKPYDEKTCDTTEYFNNGTFFNTDLQ